MGEVDSVLQLIFIRNVNLLQVYNKLEVSRTFYKFPGTFSFLCDFQTGIGKFSINSVKSSTYKKCFQNFVHFFKLFPSLLQDCVVFSTSYPGIWPVTESFVDIQLCSLKLVYSLLK